MVATRKERLKISDDPFRGRLLFVAKEAVYKAVYPLDQAFLDHHDVEIDFRRSQRLRAQWSGRRAPVLYRCTFGGVGISRRAAVKTRRSCFRTQRQTSAPSDRPRQRLPRAAMVAGIGVCSPRQFAWQTLSSILYSRRGSVAETGVAA